MTQNQNPNLKSARRLPFTKWVFLPAVLGFLAFVVYVYYYTNVFDIGSVIVKTDLVIYAAAAACIFATVICNAFAWKTLLDSFRVQTTFKRVFTLGWVGIFIDAIIPGAWFGDTYKAYLLSKDPQINGGKTAASIVIKKTFDDIITLTAIVVGAILLSVNYTLGIDVMLQIGAFMALLVTPLIMILYFSIKLSAAKKALKTLNRIYSYLTRKNANQQHFETRIEKTLSSYNQALQTLKARPRTMIKPLAWLSIGWLLNLLAAFLVFVAIGTAISADKIIITNTIVSNFQANGLALTSITQVISSTIYTTLGITPLVSITSSLLTGFATFWFKTIIAFGVFQALTLTKQTQNNPSIIEQDNSFLKYPELDQIEQQYPPNA